MGDSSEAVPQLSPQKTRRPSRPRRQKRTSSHQNGVANGHSHSDTIGTPPRRTSHELARPGSTSAQAVTETPLKPAYAGPTFHASPAASALPVPRFASKSMPTNVEQSGLQARLNEESDRSDDPASSSVSTPKLGSDPGRDREPTPIDFLLDADRKEKARVGSEGSGMQIPDRDPFLQKMKSEPSRYYGLPENARALPTHHSRAPSSRGMFPMELDGTQSENHNSAPQSTPDQSRVPTLKSNTDPSTLFQVDNEAAAQSLKDLLGVPNSPQSPPVVMPNAASNYNSASPQLHRNQSSNSSIPLSESPIPPITPLDATRRPPSNLHYGNRNLSPLFQAARAPLQHRPSSGLRQEVVQEPPPVPAELPASTGPASPSRPLATAHSLSLPSNPKFDAKTFSRAYLDAQIQAAHSGSPPVSLPSRSTSAIRTHSNTSPIRPLGYEPSPFNSPSPAYASSDQRGALDYGFTDDPIPTSHCGVENSAVSGTVKPQAVTNGSPIQTKSTEQDLKFVENNLRKILNLQTQGAQDGASHS